MVRYYIGMMAYGDNSLYHHGIKGQKWGIRRFQNPDGTLTPAGKERYRKVYEDESEQWNKWRQDYSSGKTKEAYQYRDERRLRARLGDEVVDGWLTNGDFAELRNTSYISTPEKDDIYSKWTGPFSKKYKSAKDEYQKNRNYVESIDREIADLVGEMSAKEDSKSLFWRTFKQKAHSDKQFKRLQPIATEEVLQKHNMKEEDLSKAWEKYSESLDKVYAVEEKIDGYLKTIAMAKIINTVPDDLKDDAWTYLRANWSYD